MKTRVVTTNPAGHTVSIFHEQLTAYEIANIYKEFYTRIDVIHEENTIPQGWFIKCYNAGNDPELYQIKLDKEG